MAKRQLNVAALDQQVLPMLDRQFTKTLDAPVLSFKSKSYTHRQLVSIGVGNLKAARTLEEKCKALGVRTAGQLHNIGPRDLLRTVGVGNATIWVAMHVLADHGYDVAKWWGWKPGVTPKFSSYRESVRRQAQENGGGRHVV